VSAIAAMKKAIMIGRPSGAKGNQVPR